ncbi:MAG: sulfite exporter TauE/SafE family protein [Nitrososphaerota archaeon]
MVLSLDWLLLAFELVGLGVAVGAAGTLVGIGGGFIVVPILLTVFHFEPGMAAGTSMVMIFFNSLSGSIAYLRQRRVDLLVGISMALSTIPGTIIGGIAVGLFDTSSFRLAFAILLLSASLYMMFRPAKFEGGSGIKKWSTLRRIVDNSGHEYSYVFNIPIGAVISFFVGILANMFGIGGGIIHVPTMILLFGVPTHVATATSHFILMVTSFSGLGVHLQLGNIDLSTAIPLGLGAVIGAQLGARISQRVRGRTLERIFSVFLMALVVRLILQNVI